MADRRERRVRWQEEEKEGEQIESQKGKQEEDDEMATEDPPEPVTVWMPAKVLPAQSPAVASGTLSADIESLLEKAQAQASSNLSWPKPTAFSVALPPGVQQPGGQKPGPPRRIRQERIASSSPVTLSSPSLLPMSPAPLSLSSMARLARHAVAPPQTHARQPSASPPHPHSPTRAMSPRQSPCTPPSASPPRQVLTAHCAPATPGSRGSTGTPLRSVTPKLPTWRAAPMASVGRTLEFKDSHTPSSPVLDADELCKQRARDERAPVSGAQAQISQLSNALRAADEKCRRQDTERWALVHEAMRELSQLRNPARPADRRATTPDMARRTAALRLAAAQLTSGVARRTPGAPCRSSSADRSRQSDSPLAGGWRNTEMAPSSPAISPSQNLRSQLASPLTSWTAPPSSPSLRALSAASGCRSPSRRLVSPPRVHSPSAPTRGPAAKPEQRPTSAGARSPPRASPALGPARLLGTSALPSAIR